MLAHTHRHRNTACPLGEQKEAGRKWGLGRDPKDNECQDSEIEFLSFSNPTHTLKKGFSVCKPDNDLHRPYINTDRHLYMT